MAHIIITKEGTIMTFTGTLGVIAMGITAVTAVVASVKTLISEVNETLQEVEELLQTLSDESEGSFKDAVVEAGNWLNKKFQALVAAITKIIDYIAEAMRANERTDEDGATELRSAIC